MSRDHCSAEPGQAQPAIELGAVLGGAGVAGRDKVVLVEPAGSALGGWVCQLLVETTGGHSRGLVPVQVATADAPGTEPAADLHLVVLGQPDALPDTGTVVAGTTGAQLVGWQVAAVVAARALGLDPFARKVRQAGEPSPTSALLVDGAAGDGAAVDGAAVDGAAVDGAVEVRGSNVDDATTLAAAVDQLLAAVPDRGYVAIVAHLDPVSDAPAVDVRELLAARLAHPVSFAWGSAAPQAVRNAGVLLQLTGSAVDDAPVPGGDHSLGDRQAELARQERDALGGRPMLHLHLTDRARGLDTVLEALRA